MEVNYTPTPQRDFTVTWDNRQSRMSSVTRQASTSWGKPPVWHLNLPTGLNIDSSTCTISGTPTVEAVNATYEINATIGGDLR